MIEYCHTHPHFNEHQETVNIMGNFDIDSKYSESIKLKLRVLAREIAGEISASTSPNTQSNDTQLSAAEIEQADKEIVSDDTVYQKLKNAQKTGLIDKLDKLLHFDVLKIAEKSPQEYFDMLKILKLLYYIEKPRNALERIRITDILAKPQPGNIITDDSMTTIYGDVFQKLYDKIRSAVADADFRCSALMSIDREWRYISLQTFNHLLSPQALKFPQESYEELYRIKDFLTKIHIKLNDISDEQRTRPEGVMNTFFNILACHKFLCMENGKIAVNTQVSQVTPPNPSYIEKFKEIQTLDPASWSILERLHNNLDAKSSDDNANFILRMAAYDSDIPDDDITS